MDKKTCLGCGEEKPIVEFNLVGNERRRNYCQPCERARKRDRRPTCRNGCGRKTDRPEGICVKCEVEIKNNRPTVSIAAPGWGFRKI